MTGTVEYDDDYEDLPTHPGYTDREIELSIRRVEERIDELE